MTAVQSAHRISDEAEALAVAADLAAQFAEEAAGRDAGRQLPYEQVGALAASGLLALGVPREHGGIDARTETLAEVFRILAEGDPSIAQIPHSHYTFLEVLRHQGTPAQQEFFYSEVLAGRRFANAQSERGTKTIDIDATTLTEQGGDFVVDGRKFYSTGALFADWIAVRATLPGTTTPTGKPAKAVAYLPSTAAGLSIVDDWDGMGQKTTASGTVTLDAVRVPAFHVVPFSPIFDAPTTYGSQAQILHAAIDAGIAAAALNEGVRSARQARPYFEAGVTDAVDDPLLIQLAGEAAVTVRSATALLREGARSIDAARRDLTEQSAAVASIDAAAAKVAAARASLEASTVLFELGGTRSASETSNLSRYWRDARTHTLHDPTRWKIQHIGRWTLSGTVPPRHGLL
ncbi:SfnB family sulfur acquisition oxidoreductase [Rhodococcus sp. JVH1]|uniref:SfnB family sulfur acquisition oxidoreductase n=1 Tax=Rhodococcus sp. JVH1 TaxID=745408 RepID=UPI0002722191|nr:SfnB family sulfur acquisition oxidoreductase [Rhodococcus sp. JVH1]EJI99407.1 acyl-CoA dehydrogenase, C-terminal domain protein [Rhodococcus sp. JVH1]